MNTKKWIALCLFVLLLIVALVAAYLIAREEFKEPLQPLPNATATPVPEPTEEPLPPLVAFAAPQTEASFRAAIASLPRVDLIDTEAAQIAALTGIDAAVVCISSAADAEAAAVLIDKGIPVVAYNPMGLTLPDAAIEVRFAASVPKTAADAMETAIAYPPHDTPVRLLGVFSAADSEAASVWNEAVSAGRVLDKGTFCASEGGSLTAWFSDRLNAFFPGMVDAAFVETPAQAAELAKAMVAAGRDDFEIFTVGTDAALSQLMADHPRLLPTAVQTDDAAAGEACARALSQLLSGAAAQDIVIGE